MDAARVAPVAAVAAGAAAVWLVPGLDPLLGVLVALLGAVAAGSFLTGYGGPYLVLCLGEAFAVGLAVAAPVLGVVAQPVIAVLVVGTGDRRGLLLAAGAATIAAAGMLLVRHTLVPLLVVAAAAAVFVLALAGLEAWVRARFSGG
ncbi:MAG: hypothetical protein ABFC38_05995 [Methanospirillum sp.]